MKLKKKVFLVLGSIALLVVATLPIWGPNSYLAFKNRIAKEHTETSKRLELDGNLSSAIERAKAAYKLDPNNLEIARQLGSLLEKKDVTEAIRHYEEICKHPSATRNDKLTLTRLAMRAGKISVAEKQLNTLREFPTGKDLEYHFLVAKSLEAKGQIPKAIQEIRKILSEEETSIHKKARYAFVRLAIRSGNPNLMQEAKDTLNLMSLKEGTDGIEAIRFYFSISGFTATEAFDILRKTYKHPRATLEDKLEAATIYQKTAPNKTEEIISELSNHFDLTGAQPEQLYSFCMWLGRIQQWEQLMNLITKEKSHLSSKLFTLRLDALANLEKWELVAEETTNRNVPIENHFRLVFRARALNRIGETNKANEQLEILHAENSNNRETLLNICEYLERTRDIQSLVRLLHDIIENDPLLKSYALRKLLIYERNTATLKQICNWYEALHQEGKNLQQFRGHKAYYDLLANNNISESVLVAKSLYASASHLLEARVLMALAHLRTNDPDSALKVIEANPQPDWTKGRIGWQMLYTHILKINLQSEKAEKILQTIATAKLTVAEREGLDNL